MMIPSVFIYYYGTLYTGPLVYVWLRAFSWLDI